MSRDEITFTQWRSGTRLAHRFGDFVNTPPSPCEYNYIFSTGCLFHNKMSSPADLSLDTTSLVDEFQLDSNDIFASEPLSSSPIKRNRQNRELPPPLEKVSIPELKCDPFLPPNELFQLTTHLRKPQDSMLHHNKIAKLLNQLQATNDDLELDDQLRTRVFKGRFSNKNALDSFDLRLDSFLAEKAPPVALDDNKENSAIPEPLKRKLRQPAHETKRLRRPARVPVLSALPNVINGAVSPIRSPQRICVPKRQGTPHKPVLKPLNELNIYLVNSLTGLINDATQFGTELNASNCEGFPMPEDVNEVVQIPTNESVPTSAQQKMAIIKAFHGTRFPGGPNGSRGFYSKQESDEYRRGGRTLAARTETRRVHWADDLEW